VVGKREEVIALLVGGAGRLAAHGCSQYTVAAASDDETTIWVTEVWESKDAHDASLQLPEVREQIGKARPLIAGGFTRTETTVSGGLGL